MQTHNNLSRAATRSPTLSQWICEILVLTLQECEFFLVLNLIHVLSFMGRIKWGRNKLWQRNWPSLMLACQFEVTMNSNGRVSHKNFIRICFRNRKNRNWIQLCQFYLLCHFSEQHSEIFWGQPKTHAAQQLARWMCNDVMFIRARQ